MYPQKLDFTRYQKEFYRKVMAVPFEIELEIITVTRSTSSGTFSMEEIVGDSPRSSVFYKFRALYNREISSRSREKYGLPLEVDGEVFLSPLQLIPVLGTFKLDWNKTKFHFAGRTQVVDKIDYLEPLWDSCIALQIFLKDDIKGG